MWDSLLIQWQLDCEQSHKNEAFEWSCKNVLLAQQSSKDFLELHHSQLECIHIIMRNIFPVFTAALDG